MITDVVPDDARDFAAAAKATAEAIRAARNTWLIRSPRLLDARCSTIDEIQLVNALCRLVEYAEG